MVLPVLIAHFLMPKDESWSEPNKPYRVAGNIYQVGTKGIGVYLITSPKGHIVLDSSTKKGADVVEANIRTLGFKLSDVKFLIETHAHFDHVGGTAQLKANSRAKLVAMAGDRFALENGVHDGENEYTPEPFPPVKVDSIISDGGTLELGGIKLTAHATPGHTKGDTSWTMVIRDPKIQNGKALRVIFYGSTTVAGNRLVGNKTYPNIVRDYRKSFAKLRTLNADIFLVNHPFFADLAEKRKAQIAGKVDAFVVPNEFASFVKESAVDFEEALAKQRESHKPGQKSTKDKPGSHVCD
jgi:metallo-beta-lactamase class B